MEANHEARTQALNVSLELEDFFFPLYYCWSHWFPCISIGHWGKKERVFEGQKHLPVPLYQTATDRSLFCSFPGSPVTLVTQPFIGQTSTRISIRGPHAIGKAGHNSGMEEFGRLCPSVLQRDLQWDVVTFHGNTGYVASLSKALCTCHGVP